MAITQLSLFLMNQPGQLVDAVGILSEGGANIRAMSIAESNDFGILRAIVSDTDLAVSLLKEKYLIQDGKKCKTIFPYIWEFFGARGFGLRFPYPGSPAAGR